MAIRSRKFSHSLFVKTIVFMLISLFVIGVIYTAIHIFKVTNGNIEIIFENNYLESSAFNLDNDHTIYQLNELIETYVSEEYILEGHTIDDVILNERIEQKYWEREDDTLSDNNSDNMVDKELRREVREEIIASDLAHFKRILNELSKKSEPLYYVTDGEHEYTNTTETKRAQFEKYPIYFISDGSNTNIYPSELGRYAPFYGDSYTNYMSQSENTKMFVAYTEDYIKSASNEWGKTKERAMNALYVLAGFVALFFLGFIYLIITTGKDSFKDKKVYMQPIDKIYVDVQLVLLLGMIGMSLVIGFDFRLVNWLIYPLTLIVVIIYITLLLSLVRHIKNKTFFKHTLLFVIIHSLYRLVNDIYNSGSVGMKVVIVVILYPIITATTVFFFPIVIGIAVWLALKKVKDFNEIQDGTKMMKEGDLQHQIKVAGKGEFATLAANINGINEGFKQAVHNELKNERLKTELITNVSHDIRTPLTSLITYTDLLKTETDPEKIKEYTDILDQKSKRLKVLTDDLFAAAKASSGDIPVELQHIDIVALINQGIGEVSDQISAKNLEFRVNYSEEKMFVIADGKLLWRSIENILTNIFNYALEGSRVYIDMFYENDKTLISFKNISKYELNITEEELMERFTRGDESRSSHGSGLGLSITKSLIENQNGTFEISIDGDLFKSIIYLPSVMIED